MTPDDQDEDRTVIRPPGSTQLGGNAGFQKTEWSAGNAISGGGMDKTEIVGAPPAMPAGGHDMGGTLPVGTRLGEFEITRFVAEGGFGIVYLAHDHSLQRRVALKEYMPSSLAQRGESSQVRVKSERYRETFEAGLKSFINEARLLASFDHPSLIKVYRFWEANGTAYMVMPFLEGTTMKDVLRAMQAPPDEAWLRSVLGPLTEALLVIHAEQCYHRDIAPDNVMLLPGSNRWLLLDFGAARRVISEQTQALTVILKPGYAPVEQYAEIPGMKQGPWTDVYALAAVVYFAIIGKTPPPSVGRLLNDTYVPLSQAAAGRYSEQLLGAVDRALAVRPEQRTQSIGEFRQDMGLGEAAFDTYSTRPLPPNADVPARRPGEATQAYTRGAAPATQMQPQTAMQTPVTAPAPAPAMGAAPAAKKGNGALIGVGIGVVVLGALGFGAYALLTPKPRPAETVAATPVPAPAPAAAASVPAAAPVAAPAPAPVAAAPAPGTFDVSAEFQKVLQAQSTGFDVKLQTNQTSYRIGKDYLRMTVTAEREGFLYLFAYGADKTLFQLYPSITSGSLKVKKGQQLRLPLGNEQPFETTGPAGPTELMVVVSARQRDHSALRPTKEGTIRQFPTGAKAAELAAQFTGSGPVLAGQALCPSTAPCEDEFGAAVVRVEVVP
jgi:serine/threonine protein kinase